MNEGPAGGQVTCAGRGATKNIPGEGPGAFVRTGCGSSQRPEPNKGRTLQNTPSLSKISSRQRQVTGRDTTQLRRFGSRQCTRSIPRSASLRQRTSLKACTCLGFLTLPALSRHSPSRWAPRRGFTKAAVRALNRYTALGIPVTEQVK